MKKILSPKVVICALLMLISGTALAGWLYLEHSLEKSFQSFIHAHSELDIAYKELRTNPLKKSIELKHPTITYGKDIAVSARSMTFQDLAVKNKIPVKMTVKARDMDIKTFFPSLDLARELQLPDFRPSDINGVLAYKYHPQKNRLDISRFVLENHKLGLFCSRLTLTSINADYILSLQNPFLLGAALLGISIDYFQAGYEDYGMIKRLAELNAWDKQTGGKEEAQDLDPFLKGLSPDSRTPAQNFLRAQKPLTINISPQKPVPFSAILTSQDQEAVAELLNLKITNQKPDFCVSLEDQ